MQVAVVGHIEWVWFGSVDRIPGPGEIAHAVDDWQAPAGGGAVAAVQLSKLAGACDFFTALGPDETGDRAVDELSALGIDVHADRQDHATRRALTLVDPAGERTITTLGRRLQPSGAGALPWHRLADAGAVYVTAGDAEAFRQARRARTMVVTTRVLAELLDSGVMPDALVGSAADPAEHVDPERLPWRPPLLVRTEGRSGGRYETASGATGRYEAVEPWAVRLDGVAGDQAAAGDAYGAGDSFAAGLTFGLGAGHPAERALALAARCGAACASGRGPYSRQLTAADL